MGIFSRNTKLNSDEYERLTKKLIEVNSDLQEIKKEFESLRTNQNSLRGLINRRIGGDKENNSESETLNNPVILPDNGNPFKYR